MLFRSRRMKQRKGTVTEVVLSDGRGRISVVFFNQPWRENAVRVGRRGLFAGTVSAFGRTRQLAHPAFVLLPADAEDTADAEAQAAFADLLIPIYPATSSLPSWRIQKAVRTALGAVDDVDDPIPAEVRSAHGLMPLGDALQIGRAHV